MADTNTNPPILSKEYLNALKNETNKRISLLNLNDKTYEIWDGTAREVIEKIIENLNFITGDVAFGDVIPKVKQIYTELKHYENSATDGLAESIIDTLFNRINTAATSTQLGPIKIGYTTNATDRNYAVELNDGKAYVNVPWTDTVYTHPSYSPKNSGLYKITVDETGHVSAATAVAKADITALGIPAQDTTYTLGGLMGSPSKGGPKQPIYWDGTKFTDTTYKLDYATGNDPGIIKLGYTESGKNYAVKLDSTTNKAYVSVPWTDTDTVYTHPSYSPKNSGLYKITVDETGHVSAATAVAKADITALGIPAQDTTPNNAKLTINGDNSTKVEFTANASSPVTKTVSGSLYEASAPTSDNGYTLTLGVKIQFS